MYRMLCRETLRKHNMSAILWLGTGSSGRSCNDKCLMVIIDLPRTLLHAES
jgi:hypothetical protein